MHNGRFRWLVVAAALLVGVGIGALPSLGQTSRKLMNLQGRLTDTEGSPTTGPHLFELRIFDSGPAGSGTQIYYEAQRVVVNKGIYNVLVGDGYNGFTGDDPDSYAEAGGKTGGIPASVFNRDDLWLEIEIDEDNPLDPRTRVVSSAYAMNADTLDGKDSSSFLQSGDDAVLADVQVNNLSFVGGGGLDASTWTFGGTPAVSLTSSQVSGLTGGADTTLHKHPGAGAKNSVTTWPNVSYESPQNSWGDVTNASITFTKDKADTALFIYYWNHWFSETDTGRWFAWRFLVDGNVASHGSPTRTCHFGAHSNRHHGYPALILCYVPGGVISAGQHTVKVQMGHDGGNRTGSNWWTSGTFEGMRQQLLWVQETTSSDL